MPGNSKMMTGKFILPTFAVVLVFAISPVLAGFGFKLDGTLDKEAISHAYFEGEFSRVLPPLETYRQSFPETATKEDSIFVFKFLSVIYTADSSTRHKGESYMIQLLKLMPTIELIDMYISDNIQAIFKNVKQNFLKEQRYVKQYDTYGKPLSDSSTGKRGNSSGRNKWMGMAIGGMATAAVAIGAYYVMNDDSPPETDRVTLPSDGGK